ncbi:helix-turn-helix domain-containing protein [Pseudalkalibacillus caeni]|uniref:Helix-turn-helix transcriptional regulator n=1 Tax=Exobacillus caeni TaxID=2574798 RepID=A0A5R9F401_9BACL|nr:helix-turn-helix transcriptional regulator [Pseudalkalibacillus caeni]TLS37731.1 helix-turn-helix transcriptional regulator [Pseudalkalibacillus caeni]
MATIKSNLKPILESRGLSIREVAREIDYRFESVRQLYNDETKKFPKELLERLCEYLNVTPGEILELEKDPSD